MNPQDPTQRMQEIIDKFKRNDNMIFYTDTVKGRQTNRDDLWAVSTEELDQALAELSKVVDEVRMNTEHYWIKYYGDQRSFYDGSDGDMPQINELKRHQQLHKNRLAALQQPNQKEG